MGFNRPPKQGPGPNSDPLVIAFGEKIGIVGTNPEQDRASWILLKFLTSPQTQSEWVGYTGHLPSQSTTDVGSRAVEEPIWGGASGLARTGEGRTEPGRPWRPAGAIQDAFDAIAKAQSHDEIITILHNLNDNAAQLVAVSQSSTAALRDESNSHRPRARGSSLSIGTSRGFTPGGRFESA